MSPAGGNGAGEPPPPVLQVAFWGPPILLTGPPPLRPSVEPRPHSSQPAGSLQGSDNPHASRGLCLLRPHSPALWLCLLESPTSAGKEARNNPLPPSSPVSPGHWEVTEFMSQF